MDPAERGTGEMAGDERATPRIGEGRDEKFDPKGLEVSTGKGWIVEFILAYPQRLIAFARLCCRVFQLPFTAWYIVLRYDDVREVLSHDREFPVPWDKRMQELTNGKNFVLGMERGETYKTSYKQLAQAFPLQDIANHVEKPAAKQAAGIVKHNVDSNQKAEFDAIEELITAVPATLCQTYFGIKMQDPILFAKWTLAISSYIFGPSTDARRKRLAEAAANELSGAIRNSIGAARNGQSTPGIALQNLVNARPILDDDTIHAHLFGMVLGFIPTNVLAGGNMLETLLRRPDFLARARAAALADDDELLWRCLREALRFRHINPGPWRACPNGYSLGADSPKPYKIPAGKQVLAIIQSAMFDSRRIERPHVFDPYRRDEDYMIFGIGQHWCLGAYIAKAQITQTFKPLLKLQGLKAVSSKGARAKRFNDLFPLHLVVGFDK